MKMKLTFAMVMLMGLFSIAKSQTSGISGSAHDFSGETWSQGQICNVCHTTHNSALADAPLWNHEITGVTNYTLYTSSTFDDDGGTTILQPTSNSKLCLSCHDGTVALENFGGNTGGTTNMSGSALLGTTLADDHPISFTYDDALATADGELFLPSTATTPLGGTIDDDLLFSGTIQCASCHDVHNTNMHDHLLRIDNSASALCLVCHDK